MSTIVWDQLGERVFESGLDRGVLYGQDGQGVAWNGLISVDERSSTTTEPVYFDGVKFNDILVYGAWAGTLRAYTYPDEFLQFEGVVEEQSGYFLANQPQKRFHLCYRTKLSTDLDQDAGYKIHLLWNLTAIPSSKTHQTLALDVTPGEFEWDLTSIPEEIDKYRPTAHAIIDSRRMDPQLLQDLEDILYGTVETSPRMPSLRSLSAFIRKWDRLIITDNGDGTWTATTLVDGIIEMLDATTFQITGEEAVYLDAETYTIESSQKNEEDIF